MGSEGIGLLRCRHMIFRSAEYPWMLATPDYLLDGYPLEIKCRFREPDEREQLAFLVQLQHQMIVLGARQGVLAVSVAGNEPTWQRLGYNKRLARVIIERTREIWGYVERGELPPVEDGHAATLEALSGMHEPREREPLVLPPDFLAIEEDFVVADKMLRRGAELKGKAEATIRRAMLFHEKAVLPGIAEYRWKKRFIRKALEGGDDAGNETE